MREAGVIAFVIVVVLMAISLLIGVTAWVVLYVYSVFYFLVFLYYAVSARETENRIQWFTVYGIIVVCIIFTYAGTYWQHGIFSSVDKKIIFSFSDSLYFSIVTWTTLGYGDFSPTNDLRLIASIQALLGYLSMGLYIGVIVSTLTRR